MRTENSSSSHVRINTGTATQKRGKARVKSIIQTARTIFLNEGYNNLKLQHVATQEGISLGNLTYYFKTKEHLFRTIIDDVLGEYFGEASKFMERYADNPRLRFSKFMSVLIEDCKKHETRAFFYQLWAISIHDEFIDECRANVYAEFSKLTKRICEGLNPELDEKTLEQRVFILGSMIEGLHVMMGNFDELPAHLEGFEKEFQQQALSLITK